MTLPLLRNASEAPPVAPGRGRSLLAALAVVTLLPAVAGVLFSILFWLVNFDTASKGLITSLHGRLDATLPADLHHFLVTLSRDASTVTPLVALMLALAVARGCALVLFRPARLPRALAVSRGHFPFAAGYQTTWVQLGLIGTLGSFLLIGQQLRSGLDDPDRSVQVLLESFDTALLSTLSGVVAAFILGPLLAGAFRARLLAAGVEEETASSQVQQLTRQLTALARRTRETSLSFGVSPPAEGAAGAPSLMESALGTSRALGELEGRIQEFEIRGFAGRIVDDLVERLTRSHHEALARVEAAVDQRHAATNEALVQGLAQLGQGIVSGQEGLGRGLREGLAELAAAQRQERDGERDALLGRLAEIEGRLQADNRRLTQAIEERPLELIREVEKEGRETVLRSLAAARNALERGLRDLSSAVREMPRASGDVAPARGWWERMRLVRRRS
jgi:hypothetical protein